MLVSLTASAATTYQIETHHNENNKTTTTLTQSSIEPTIEATAARLETAAPNLNHKIVMLALETYYKARQKGYDKNKKRN